MASRFWVGGTGTWDASDTTHWAATTGGAGGQSVPGSADTVTFDGSSGGGTVTVNTTVNVQSITCGAFTGTLDFSVNNNNVTLSGLPAFNCSGSATRTINLGNGIWTLSSTSASSGTIWDISTSVGLTLNAGSSIIKLTGDVTGTPPRFFIGGGKTYNAIEFSAQTKAVTTRIASANTIGRLTVTGRNAIEISANQTITTMQLNGAASNPILIKSDSDGTSRTLSVASGTPTMTYVAFRDITGAGGAGFVASNSFDLGNNSGITINGPTGGSGSSSSGSTTPIRSPLSPPIGQ